LADGEFGAYLVWHQDIDTASEFMRRLVGRGYDPVLVAPSEIEFPSDDEMLVMEPEREDKAIRTEALIPLLRHLVNHLKNGTSKAVIIFDLNTLKQGSGFHDLSGFIGRLYEEACVNQGLVLYFANRNDFTSQELAFLERETSVLGGPNDLFSTPLETIK